MNISKSHIRKLERKQKRSIHTVEKEIPVKCTLTPSTIIAICNAGLTTGLSEEVLLEYFETFGKIKDISLPAGKSFSFVIFEDVNSSIKAYEALNGKANIGQDSKPIHLAFIEEVPYSLRSSTLDGELPPGLIILTDFITENEENDILRCLDWSKSTSHNNLKHRQVLHFGYEFQYNINNVDKNCPLPENIPYEYNFLFDRLHAKETKFSHFVPDQLTVNKYEPGQGIPPHVDTHSAFQDPILSLSLGSSVLMEFRNNGEIKPVFLPQRSLLIMSEESRYLWTHGITPRKSDVVFTENGLAVTKRMTRTSFTFRKILRQNYCNCVFPKLCDSISKETKDSKMENDQIAQNLEQKHVHQVYENIASHFSDTRHKPWPNVLEFVLGFEIGSIFVDVGCGNGKYLGQNKGIYQIGCDRSLNLLDVCKSRNFEVFTCDCLNILIQDEKVDGVISIAVIHHLASEARRIQSLKEIIRILRSKGKALIYVWAKNQEKDKAKSSYLKQDRKNRKEITEQDVIGSNVNSVTDVEEVLKIGNVSLPVHKNRTEFKTQDLLVPWKMNRGDKEVFLRYYHVFEEGELEKMCSSLENVKLLKSYYDQGNWCVILEKL